MWNAGLDELPAGIKTAGRNINNLRYVNDATLMAEKRRGTKELLDDGERGKWKRKGWNRKAGLKLNIQKTKILASSPITSWQLKGKKWKECQILFWGALKPLWMVTAAMKLKYSCFFTANFEKCRKTFRNLDSILKSRDITLPTKDHIVKGVHIFKLLVFPVIMYRCESWTIKKAERWRIDPFELWCWRRFWECLGQQDQTIQS